MYCLKQMSQTTSISFEWQIKNFSRHVLSAGHVLVSSTFTSNEDDSVMWFVKAYPNGLPAGYVGYLALYLHCTGNKTTGNEKTAKFKISILKCGSTKYNEIEGNIQIMDQQETSHGWAKFLKTDFVLDEKNGLLQNETLIIYCEISFVATSFNTSGKIPEMMLPKSRLADDMSELFKKKLFSDVVLMVNEMAFEAHKAVLAARSPVFAAMLSNDMKEKNQNIIRINDMSVESMTNMLDFIYTGEKPDLSSTKETQELLAVADKYDLSRLKTICERELSHNLTVEKASELLVFADFHNASHLKKVALDFIYNNIATITKASNWLELMMAHPSLLNEVLVYNIECQQKKNDEG